MCAASESSSPRSYPWVGSALLHGSVSPSNSPELPLTVLRGLDDQDLSPVSLEEQYLLNSCSGIPL